MKFSGIGLAAAALVLMGTASASTWDITTGASSTVAGALTDTFDPGSQINLSTTGGGLFSASVVNITAQPPGSTGNWWSIGISPGQLGPGIVTLATPVTYVGFLWGSPDSYNAVAFYSGSTLVASYGGSDVFNPADGNQAALPGGQYFNFYPTAGENITSIDFTSTQNAFEIDNLAVVNDAVPEPGTLSLVGASLLALGMLRRRRRA